MDILAIAAQFFAAAWQILNELAVYLLLGLVIAALMKGFISETLVTRHLGGNDTASVLKASLFGVPLPLCSCAVIPAAMGLRSQGASKGSATAFLISTPESGTDSIAVSWALLGPLMTVIRPLAAFVTASVVGILVNVLPGKEPGDPPAAPATSRQL